MFLNSRRAVLPIVVVGMAWLALLLDWLGRRLDQARLWIAGAHLALAALIAGCICVVLWRALATERRWRGVVFWIVGLLLLALARFLRGAAGVAPDRPLIAGVGVAALLLSCALWRRARSTLRSDRT